jgi:putative transposase
MVRHPREYRWSSYRTNAEGKVDELVSPHEEYRRLGRDPRDRCEAYRALFKVHLDEALVERIREATNGNYALGNQRFQAEIEQALGRRATRGKAGRRPKAQAEHHSKQLGLL